MFSPLPYLPPANPIDSNIYIITIYTRCFIYHWILLGHSSDKVGAGTTQIDSIGQQTLPGLGKPGRFQQHSQVMGEVRFELDSRKLVPDILTQFVGQSWIPKYRFQHNLFKRSKITRSESSPQALTASLLRQNAGQAQTPTSRCLLCRHEYCASKVKSGQK